MKGLQGNVFLIGRGMQDEGKYQISPDGNKTTS